MHALLQHGASVNERTHDRQTPLHCAAAKNHTSTATVLLKHGAEIDALEDVCQTLEAKT